MSQQPARCIWSVSAIIRMRPKHMLTTVTVPRAPLLITVLGAQARRAAGAWHASEVSCSDAGGGGHGHAVRKVVPIGLPQPLYDMVEQEALACRARGLSARSRRRHRARPRSSLASERPAGNAA